MQGRLTIEAVRVGATTRIVRAAGTPPLVARLTGPNRVHLLGAAGGPVAGDEIRIEIAVGPGATLVVGQAAATVAVPGPDPTTGPSRLTVDARVGPGGTLVMLGQPLIAAAGCRHEIGVDIELGPDACLVWRDVVVPGRAGEDSGDLTATLAVRRDTGVPVLRNHLAVGPAAPGWAGPAVTAGARCVGTAVVVGVPDRRRDAVHLSDKAMLMPLASPGAALVVALGDGPSTLAALRAGVAAALCGGSDKLLGLCVTNW